MRIDAPPVSGSAVSNAPDFPQGQAFFSFAPSTTKSACCDSGSTHLLLRQSDAAAVICTSILELISVALPNGTTISATSCGHLHFPNLPTPIPACIFPDTILHTSLLSVSELCNAGCVATFNDTSFQFTYNNLMVLNGTKSSTDKLWLVQLPNSSTIDNPSQLQSNASHLSSDAAFVSFVHASLGSPVYSTFIHAVRSGYLSTWPRLTAAIVNAHPPLTIATAKGHLNQHRQGLDSTKQFPLHDTVIDITDDITDDNDALPHIPVSEASANHAYVKVLPLLQTVSADLQASFRLQRTLVHNTYLYPRWMGTYMLNQRHRATTLLILLDSPEL